MGKCGPVAEWVSEWVPNSASCSSFSPIMTGRCAARSTSAPRPVGRPPKRKNVGKAGSVVPSTELNPSPTPPRPKPTPIFNEIPVPTSTPTLSMIEEQPADSPDISATDVDTDIAEGAMLTLSMREQEGGTATQHRLTRLSLPLKPLEDGNCSLSEDETDGEGVEEAGKEEDSLWVQYLITTPSAEPWAISFLIPLDNGISEMLPLQSYTCWDVTQFSIAETMDISVKALTSATSSHAIPPASPTTP